MSSPINIAHAPSFACSRGTYDHDGVVAPQSDTPSLSAVRFIVGEDDLDELPPLHKTTQQPGVGCDPSSRAEHHAPQSQTAGAPRKASASKSKCCLPSSSDPAPTLEVAFAGSLGNMFPIATSALMSSSTQLDLQEQTLDTDDKPATAPDEQQEGDIELGASIVATKRKSLMEVAALPQVPDLPTAPRRRAWWQHPIAIKLFVLATVSVLFVCAEIILAIKVGSLTLMSDALHNLADALMLYVALWVRKLEAQQRTKRSTYGWVRGSVVAALCACVFVLGVFFMITIQVVERFITVEVVEQPWIIIGTGFGAAFVNLLGVFMFKETDPTAEPAPNGHELGLAADPSAEEAIKHNNPLTHVPMKAQLSSKTKLPEVFPPNAVAHSSPSGVTEEVKQDLNSRAVFIHFLSDAAGSLGAVLVGFVVEYSTDPNRHYVDPIVSAAMVLFVVLSSIPVMRDSLAILMHHVPEEICLDTLRQDLLHAPGVVSLHELHIWSLTENKRVAAVHVMYLAQVDAHSVMQQIKRVFHQHAIHNSTIQLEPVSIEHFQSLGRRNLLPSDAHAHLRCDAGCVAECDPDNFCCQPTSVKFDLQYLQQLVERNKWLDAQQQPSCDDTVREEEA